MRPEAKLTILAIVTLLALYIWFLSMAIDYINAL